MHFIIPDGRDTQECIYAPPRGKPDASWHAWFARANDGARHLDRAILIRDYYRFVVVRDNIIIAPGRGYSLLARARRQNVDEAKVDAREQPDTYFSPR